ncbi:reverse transcriptase domain-containing protein [Chromobacterium subtsugae]|uniref:reverse transcriptase domain-containing protein n=1 Tax=Chromobacterium subtsugae TaxID=251747 RepID=UPI0009BE96DD|nr:reverse transcriptase domain-containing protein [Chromobacterium subtsugae]
MIEGIVKKYNDGVIDDDGLFRSLFSAHFLIDIYQAKYKNSSAKGIDRINGFQFSSRAAAEIYLACEKSINGTYRFSPYLEVLKVKNREKPPRLISVPTIRDRIILSQLNKFLSIIYPERVTRNIASVYIRDISGKLAELPMDSTWVCGADIVTFYDDVDISRLIALLSRRIKSKIALKLIKSSLVTPTVPKNCSKNLYHKYKRACGIPQGLAISNILSSIYMQPIDDGMVGMGVGYHRYVDDVLMYGERDSVEFAFKSLKRRLQTRGLKLHPLSSEKTHFGRRCEPFLYLGYRFDGDTLTVRHATVERFLQSIAAKFSDFRHNKSKRLERLSYLNSSRLKDIFVSELNEKVAGAISDNKRYGWIAYFNQINDMSLLYRIDNAISNLFGRLGEFDFTAPPNLKKLSRAYWEMKFNPTGGYVKNYDSIVSLVDKLEFLVARGRVAPDESLSDEQIESRFQSYKRFVLSSMHADEGVVY